MDAISSASAYSPAHERANTMTHAAGFAAGLIAIPLLVGRVYLSENANTADVLGAIAYGLGFLMVFGFSALYHMARKPERKGLFKVWDHISIYYLIAGTYTPLLLAFAEREDAILMLSIIWGLAGAGTIFKIFFTGRYRVVSTAIYLAMGWMVLLAPDSFRQALPNDILWWIGSGGMSYTLGVVFYLWKAIPFHHGIWHLCVLGGAWCHFVAVWKVFG